MNIVFDLDDTLYNLMGPFELVHKKLYADQTDARCTDLFLKSREYSDEIMELEKNGQIPHEDCFYQRIKRTYHDVGIEMSREDADRFEAMYRDYQKKISVGAGVEELLDLCAAHAQGLAILTNGRPKSQQAKVDALRLSRWFDADHIFVSGGIGYQKPDPKAFHYVERALGFAREDTWYVGDTYLADIVGAKKAGWHAIWFNHRDRICPDGNCADATVRTVAELREICGLLS